MSSALCYPPTTPLQDWTPFSAARGCGLVTSRWDGHDRLHNLDHVPHVPSSSCPLQHRHITATSPWHNPQLGNREAQTQVAGPLNPRSFSLRMPRFPSELLGRSG